MTPKELNAAGEARQISQVDAERAEIDAEFAAMAQDEDYLAESAQLDGEFATAGAKTLCFAEGRV